MRICGLSLPVFLLVAGLFASCQAPMPVIKVEVPVIPDDKLVEVLKDVQLAEAALQQCAPAKRDSAGQAYYSVLFQLHQVSQADFEQSLKALLTDPERTAQVYSRVSDRLVQEGAAIQK